MSTDREKILKMLAEGKITVSEAEELLDAIGSEKPETKAASSEDVSKKKLKYLRVQVDPGPGKHHDRVNIRVPLQLIRAGAKLASVIPGEAREKVNRALHEKGVEVDLNDLNTEKLETLLESLAELNIEVEDGDEQVRIFCE